MPDRKIIVSPKAQAQIAHAEAYIRDKLELPRSADEFLDSIEDKFSVLTAFPRAYKVDEQASFLSGQQIRSAHLKNHRLLYRVDEGRNEVHILSLRFGSENPKALRTSDLQD